MHHPTNSTIPHGIIWQSVDIYHVTLTFDPLTFVLLILTKFELAQLICFLFITFYCWYVTLWLWLLLTLHAWNVSAVTWSNSVPHLSKIEQSAA